VALRRKTNPTLLGSRITKNKQLALKIYLPETFSLFDPPVETLFYLISSLIRVALHPQDDRLKQQML
jgi:hypothetical protein